MNELQLTASGTIPGYRCVKLVGPKLVGVTTVLGEVAIGVSDFSEVNSGARVAIQDRLNDLVMLTAAETISEGNILIPSADGKVVVAPYQGQFIALESANANESFIARYFAG